eukprot:jgi/Picsp_1/6760/NSC_04101-R1_---NA---
MDEEASETGRQEVESLSFCDDSFGDFTEADASGSDDENDLEQEINSSQQTGDAGTGEPRSGGLYSSDPEEFLQESLRDIPGGLDAEVLASLDRLSVVDLLKEIESSSSMDPIEQKHCGHVLKRHASLETTRHPWKGSLFETEMMGRLGMQRIAQAKNDDDLDALSEVNTD